MLQSIIIYSLLMGTMLLFSVYVSSSSSVYTIASGATRQRRFWRFEIIFPLLLFAIIFGMRYDVGKDHLGYLQGYLNREYVSKGEPLFDLLSEVGWTLNLHYSLYFGVIAFIQVFFFFYAFKDERYLFPFLVFFLFTNGEWNFWMNGIRQAIAICIWLSAIKYIEQKSFYKYLFWCCIAFLFHRSAAVLVILYPLFRNGRDYFRSILLQLLLLASAFISKSYFPEILFRLEPLIASYANIIGGGAYSGYSVEKLEDSFIESDGSGLFYIFRIIVNIIIIFYSIKLKSFYNNRRFTLIYSLFIIGILSHYMFPVGVISIARPFRYFYIFQTILFAYFLYYLYKTKLKNTDYGHLHALMFYALSAIFLIVFYLTLMSANKDSNLWYQFFFDHKVVGYTG